MEGGKGGPHVRFLGLVLVVYALAGCATGPATPTLDAEAKQFQPRADKACLYVVPSNSSTAVAVALDDRKVATLDETTFLRLDVPPGRHVLAVSPASLLPGFLGEPPDTLTLEVEAGHCYYLRALWREAERGWRPFRVFWAPVSAAEGQREINIRRLILPAQ
jgi:hypothetical protein